jgi:hypothetical protein
LLVLILGFSHPSTQASVGRHSKVVAVSVSEAKSIGVHSSKPNCRYFSGIIAGKQGPVLDFFRTEKESCPSAALVFRVRRPETAGNRAKMSLFIMPAAQTARPLYSIAIANEGTRNIVLTISMRRKRLKV